MPMYLPPISRRRFLAGSVAAGTGLLAGGGGVVEAVTARPALAPPAPPTVAKAAAAVDPHRLALLSDTHVNAKPRARAWGVNMAEHLRLACDDILSRDAHPAAVLINGDLAHLRGRPDDYAAAVRLLQPLRRAGLPVHVAMGNHDRRDHFRAALLGSGTSASSSDPADDRHVTLLELPHANVLMLDSLRTTNRTRGALGDAQLDWLASTLDARPDKPALVFVHHHPELKFSLMPGGIADTPALLDVLARRRQAKALVFGHTHVWSVKRHPDGLYLVNLPATGYVFSRRQPSGWVDAQLRPGGATLQLRSIDPAHPAHGQRFELDWRA